jgi:serine/threonine protein kinase
VFGCAEDEARWFFQQLAVGLAYFHSIGVDNRELNLNNKLLTGDSTRPLLKINDFTYRCVVWHTFVRASACCACSLPAMVRCCGMLRRFSRLASGWRG